MQTIENVQANESEEAKDIRLNKDVAAFSYIWIMSFIVYAARKNSPFAQYHSKQGMVLCAMSFVWIIPWIGHFLTLIVVAGMVLGFIHAAHGHRLDVPLIGPLSRGEFPVQHYAQKILEIFQSLWKVTFSRVFITRDQHEQQPREDSPSTKS